jgi:hypothetical protein
MCSQKHVYALAFQIVLTLFAATMSQSAVAQERAGDVMIGAFEMWDGVIIDPQRGRAYLMKPERGIDAVTLEDGRLVWSSNAASKPLIVIGDRLVAQTESTGKNILEAVLIDAGSGGVISTLKSDLPAEVIASVGRTLRGRFIVRGFPGGGDDALVVWTYRREVVRGMDNGPEEEASLKAEDEKRGAVRVKVTDGAATREDIEAKKLMQLRNSSASYGNRLDDKPPSVEGVSADGRHTLRARRTANQAGASNFNWLLAERKTGAVIGQLDMNFAYAPFFVRDDLIFIQAKAQSATKGGLQSQPLRLRAINLTSRREIWNRPVRDASDLGALPP